MWVSIVRSAVANAFLASACMVPLVWMLWSGSGFFGAASAAMAGGLRAYSDVDWPLLPLTAVAVATFGLGFVQMSRSLVGQRRLPRPEWLEDVIDVYAPYLGILGSIVGLIFVNTMQPDGAAVTEAMKQQGMGQALKSSLVGYSLVLIAAVIRSISCDGNSLAKTALGSRNSEQRS